MKGLSLIVFIFLAGCVSDGSYLGGIVKVEGFDKKESYQESVESTRPESTKNENPKYLLGKSLFKTAVDVDTAFLRIKREFGFKTKEEVLSQPNGEWALYDNSFKYAGIPGVSYLMGRAISTDELNETKHHNIRISIEKDGTQTRIESKIWILEGDSSELEAYNERIKSRILASLEQ